MSPAELIAMVILGAVGVALATVVIVVLAAAARDRQKLDALAHTPCPVCQQPLGRKTVDAARLAAEEDRQLFETLPPEALADPLRLDACWLDCSHCQSALLYDFGKRAWLAVRHPERME